MGAVDQQVGPALPGGLPVSAGVGQRKQCFEQMHMRILFA